MTNFFNYENFTWDAVAELERDTPLVLPLGSGYDLSLLASQLSHPAQIGLLPPFPFGWRGSGLEIPRLLSGPGGNGSTIVLSSADVLLHPEAFKSLSNFTCSPTAC